MAELIIIVAVILLGGLAYYLFADADRSELLSSKFGPYTPLLWVFMSLIQEFDSLYERRFVPVIIWLIFTVFWTYTYLKQRAERRSLKGL